MILDVAEHTRRLEMVASSYTDLARLYAEECDRFWADPREPQKGYLPTFNTNEYERELKNLAEQVCHSPNPVQAAKDAMNSSQNSRIPEFFHQIFNSLQSN